MSFEFLPDGANAAQIIAIYLESMGKMVRQMEECLHRLAAGDPGQELALVHRLSHTIKGSSLQLGFREIGQLAEAMEGLAERRLTAGRVSREDQEVLKEAVKRLGEYLECLEHEMPLADPTNLCARMKVGMP